MKIFFKIISIYFIICSICLLGYGQQHTIKNKSVSPKAQVLVYIGKTKTARIIPDVHSKLYLVKISSDKIADGSFFTKISFASPDQKPVYKIKIILLFNKEMDNVHSTVQGLQKDVFQKIEKDNKSFSVTAATLGKNSILRITIQSKMPVFTTIKGVRGRLYHYIMRTKNDDHDH